MEEKLHIVGNLLQLMKERLSRRARGQLRSGPERQTEIFPFPAVLLNLLHMEVKKGDTFSARSSHVGSKNS